MCNVGKSLRCGQLSMTDGMTVARACEGDRPVLVRATRKPRTHLEQDQNATVPGRYVPAGTPHSMIPDGKVNFYVSGDRCGCDIQTCLYTESQQQLHTDVQ